MKANLLALAACALLLPSVPAQSLPSTCGPYRPKVRVKTTKRNHPPLQAAPGKATLVFVNNEDGCPRCGPVSVGLDGAWAGANSGDSYFAVTVAAGDRYVCAYGNMGYLRYGMSDEPRYMVRLTELNAKPGAVYYFETASDPGAIFLREIAPDEGKFLVSQSSLAIWPAQKR